MAYECSLCGIALHTENPRIYWCSKCWADWSYEIKANVPWTVFLRNLENKRRYRERCEWENDISFVYLGDKFDIAEVDGKAKLIATKNFYEGGE